jgi:hypothetical protein
MPSARSANTDLPACLANPPDDFVGLFIAFCSSCRACEAAFGDEVVVNPERTISLMYHGA